MLFVKFLFNYKIKLRLVLIAHLDTIIIVIEINCILYNNMRYVLVRLVENERPCVVANCFFFFF